MNPITDVASRTERVPRREDSGWSVLLATDGSEGSRRAIEAAARLPWPAGSAIRVVTVVDTRSELPETISAHRRAAEASLAGARAELSRTGHAVSAGLLEGAPARAILAEADAWPATVIVLGARGLGKLRGLALGSVSAAVVRAAHCSVLVVKTNLSPLRTLVAVDTSPQATAAARQIARLQVKGQPVTILRVIEPPSIKSLGLLPAAASAVLRSEVEAATRDLERNAKAQVGELAGEFKRAGWKAQTSVTPGVPVREIKATIARTRATLVCTGARGATGLERLLLGSVSEALLAAPGFSLFIGR
jgi:nucleotide-binding universal stress UspA family protein